MFIPGSDSWTAEEKCYFNKGIGAYRKDFFLVQKLVQSCSFDPAAVSGGWDENDDSFDSTLCLSGAD